MTYIEKLSRIRTEHPERIAEALASRKRPPTLAARDRLLVIACDHPARAALGAGSRPMAMASREDLLDRCVRALGRPGVNGFLGSADIVEDLALLGALEGKHVWGSMNRGGLQGASFEMDDRFTGYSAQAVADGHLEGGKMLLRVNYEDRATAPTLESAAHAVDALAERHLTAMIEPFVSRRERGRIVNDLSADAVIRSIAVSQGLGSTSAYTWLKLPCVDDMERVMEATTLPSLILGGEVPEDPEEALNGWGRALRLPNVRGLVIGRSLLYPSDDDVEAAVDKTVELL